MPRSIVQHVRLILAGVLAVGVLMLLIGGLAWVAGEGRATSPGYRLAGAGMSLAAVVIMSMTVRRWAKYFVGLCLIAAAQAVFALLAGHTLSQPHVVTNRLLVCLMLGMLLALILFSARFAAEPPRTRFDSIALVVAVVGLLGTMLTEPDVWPLIGALVVLGGAWGMDRLRRVQERVASKI